MRTTAKNMRRRAKIQKGSRGFAVLKMCGILLLTVFADQAGKAAVSRILIPGGALPVAENIFHITLVHNPGGVFGLLPGKNILLVCVSAAFLILLLSYYLELESSYPGFYLPAGLAGGGAAGNMIDRIRFGYVIDFLDFRVWPVFNIADVAITIGVTIAVWKILKKPAA